MANKEDIQAHYDNVPELFKAMLDESMIYSGAMWDGAKNLTTAQHHKMKYLAELGGYNEHTESILDIGCGWGYGIQYLANASPQLKSAVGLTISDAQYSYANRKFCGENIRFIPGDCFETLKQLTQPFDTVISIGAFEHFANSRLKKRGQHIPRYRDFFSKVELLCRSHFGLQTIVSHRPLSAIPKNERKAYLGFLIYLNKYIFPNSLLPKVEDIIQASEHIFSAEKVEVNFQDYELTLKQWLLNLEQATQLKTTPDFQVYIKYIRLCIEQFQSQNIGLARFSFRKKNI